MKNNNLSEGMVIFLKGALYMIEEFFNNMIILYNIDGRGGLRMVRNDILI